jgi:hypothetical protein
VTLAVKAKYLGRVLASRNFIEQINNRLSSRNANKVSIRICGFQYANNKTIKIYKKYNLPVNLNGSETRSLLLKEEHRAGCARTGCCKAIRI